MLHDFLPSQTFSFAQFTLKGLLWTLILFQAFFFFVSFFALLLLLLSVFVCKTECNAMNVSEMRPSNRVCHYRHLYNWLRWHCKGTQKPQSSRREFREADPCSQVEAFHPAFPFGQSEQASTLLALNEFVWTGLFGSTHWILQFNGSLRKGCNLYNHVLRTHILNLYFASVHYPIFNYIFAGAHCCVVTVCKSLFITLQPGGCLNPVISARCLPKKILILDRTPAWKHVEKVNKNSLQLPRPDRSQMQIILKDFICCVSY